MRLTVPNKKIRLLTMGVVPYANIHLDAVI